MEKQEQPTKEKKSFWGMMLIISVLIVILLILIIVNPDLNKNSSERNSGVEEVMDYMKENNIVIYGLSTCGWCEKLLKEFKPYQEKVIEEGLFIHCDLTQDMGCIGVESIPAWKKDGNIIRLGYLPLEEIKNVI